jgi:hypothetical protein
VSRVGSTWGPLGVGLFIALAGGVAWGYSGLEGPHALALLIALAGWLSLFTLAAIGLGAPLARRVSGEPLAGLESWVVAAASGAVALAAVAGTLGAIGLLAPAALLAVLLAAAAGGAVVVVKARPSLPARLPALPAAVLAFGAIVTLLAVATPSPFYDQVHYHLAFPERWLRSGRIEVFPRHSYSYLAANMGLLYTYALAGPGVWAAQAIHWWMGLLATCGAFAIARKIGAGREGAAWAVAFIVATPSFLLSSTWAASDLAVAAFGATGCLMVLDAVAPEKRRGARWYVLAGLLCGAAFGSKYVALTSVALPAALILMGALLATFIRGGDRSGGVLRLVAWGGGMSAAILPWAARNAWLTGNPVHPFLASVFGRFHPDQEIAAVAHAAAGIAGSADEGASLLATLTLRTFEPQGAAGWIGPLWLILLPLWIVALVFGKRTPRAVALAVGVATGIAAWTQFHQLGRYLLPLLVLAAAGIGMAWEQMQSAVTGTLRRATVVLVAFVMLWSIQGGLSEAVFTRISCTFGRSDPRQFLERYVTYWAALPIVNERLPEDARILLVGEPRSLHLDRDVVVEDPFHKPYLIEVAEVSSSGPEMAALLRERGITHVLYNEQEAARIARMRDQPGYFAGASAPVTARLQEFLGGCLVLVEEAKPVRVYRVDASCRPS